MPTKALGTKLNLLLTLAVIAALGVAATALAQGPGHRAGPGAGPGALGGDDFGPAMHLERMQARLELTEDQVATIGALQEESRAAILALRKDIMRLRNAERGEMLKDEPSTDQILALTRQIGEKRTEVVARRVEMRLAIRKLLTPEQRDKILLEGGFGGSGRHGGRGHGGERVGRGPGATGPGCGGCGRDSRGGCGGRGQW